MQDPIKPIPTPDQKFHDGNPATGELGTIVSADWLNNVQSALQATQQEVLSVLKDTGQNSDPARQDQLLQAVKKIAWGGNSKPTTLAGYGITDGLTLRPQLGDRVDLNNITDDGLYHNPANAYAVNGANYPVPYAGLLFAFSDGEMVYQQYQSFNNAGCWYRCRYRGNWTQWQKLADAATTLAGYGITDGATKAELKAAVDGLVSGAPGALNTLQELAAALGNDQNFAATITNKLAGKADKSSSLAGYGITDALTQSQSDIRYFQRMARLTANSQFTIPNGVNRIFISGCAGGGGGGGSASSNGSLMAAGGGGGAGEHILSQSFPVKSGQVLNITIGGGGSGGIGGPSNGTAGSVGNSGTSGGNTIIPELGLSLSGGGGGGGGNTSGAWGNGAGPGNGGNGMPPGTVGWSGAQGSFCMPGGLGGSSPFGGGGGTVSWFWGGGTSQNGAGFGSGGGGGFAGGNGSAGIAGANGAPGVIIIEW